MGKRKKEDDTFLRKKNKKNQNSVIIVMITVVGKGKGMLNGFSSEVEIRRGNIKQGNFKKYLINLIEKNHQIKMSSDHSISSNNSFKSHLNAKSFSMILTLQQLYNERRYWFGVFCKGDMNSAWGKNTKEPSSSAISAEV